MHEYTTLQSGTGLPLLLLHGVMGKPSNWEECFPYLPGDCHAIAVRFPFFDEDEHLAGVPEVVTYVQRFLDQAGFDEYVLCGNSLGGHVALDLAINQPERVCGLVLAGSSGLFERSFTAIPGIHPSRAWLADKVREVFYDPIHAKPEIVDEAFRVASSRRHARELIRVAMSAKRDNVAARLHGIICPTLLLWGRQDRITPPEVAEEFHQRISTSELAWIDECGHAPMMEHPAQFAAIFSDWWARRVQPCAHAVAPC